MAKRDENGGVVEAIDEYGQLQRAMAKFKGNRTFDQIAELINIALGLLDAGPLRKLKGGDISKVAFEKQCTFIALKALGVYFGCHNEKVIFPNLNLTVSDPDLVPSNSEEVRGVKQALVQVIKKKTERTKKGDIDSVLTSSNAKLVLAHLYNLKVSGSREGFDRIRLDPTTKKERPVRNIVDSCQKLTDEDACDLAALLTEQIYGSDYANIPFPRGRTVKSDVNESKNFERRRSQIAKLSWPKPYRNQWVYIENSIANLRKFTGNFNEFFATTQDQKSYEFSLDEKEDLSQRTGALPPDAENFGFIYDPYQHEYIHQFRVKKAPISDVQQWRPSSRLAHPIYLALVRGIRRRELLLDQELIGIEAGLTRYNVNIRVQKCRFSAVVGSHFTAGVSIFSKFGDRIYDGLWHVAQDGQWMLMRTHQCPNVLRVSSIVITKDSHLFVMFSQISSFFRQKTWQPLVSGFITAADYNRAMETEDEKIKLDETLTANEKEDHMTLHHLAEQTIRRKLKAEFAIEGEQMIGKIESIGVSFDVIHGRIPTVFQLTTLKMTKDDLVARLSDKEDFVFRTLGLIADYTPASFLELLEMAAYEDAELLKANIFFALKHEVARLRAEKVELERMRNEQEKKDRESESLDPALD